MLWQSRHLTRYPATAFELVGHDALAVSRPWAVRAFAVDGIPVVRVGRISAERPGFGGAIHLANRLGTGDAGMSRRGQKGHNPQRDAESRQKQRR